MSVTDTDRTASAEADEPEGWVSRVRRAPMARRIGNRPAARWLASGVVLGAAWAVVEETKHEIPSWEQPVFEAFNQLPDGLRPAVWPVMQLGNFWVWAAATPVGFAVFRRSEVPVSWIGSTVLGWGLAKVVKERAGRGRPADIFEGVQLRESGISGLGFVSGHSTIAFALSTTAAPYLPPPWRGVCFTAATLVGLSRLYVGAHLPLDVIGGAGLGVLCGLAASLATGTPDVPAVAAHPPATAG